MQKYNDRNGDSNVDEFDFGQDFIIVKFRRGGIYTYTYTSAGPHHVEEMKRLARSHDGLNSYINKNKPQYSNRN